MKDIVLWIGGISLVIGAGLSVRACVQADNRAAQAWTDKIRAEEQPFIDKCEAAGGLIVRGQWNPAIVDCKVIR